MAKLRTLQCHFTWNIRLETLVEVEVFLAYLTHKAKHTCYGNRGTYVTMKAFLFSLRKRYAEALSSLLEAEVFLMQDRPASFLLHNLVTYGNYAWVYYHLANFHKVEFYLAEIRSICQSLNSSHPYSVMTPEILGQKGWSLLVGGPQSGAEAMRCFQAALQDDPSNEELKGGLASSLYAMWECHPSVYHWDFAKVLLEDVVLVQPQNYEAKLYLANLLLDRDKEAVNGHLEDVAQNNLNVDVLHKAAMLCLRTGPQGVSRAVSILQKAVGLDPTYPFLYYDLGMCYKYHMMVGAPAEERGSMLEAATVSFQRAAETDPLFVFPMLELAKIYGESVPAYEEEIYMRLLQELPVVSKPCQQGIYLFWGDFLLHKKEQKDKALEMFLAGLRIPGGRFKEKEQLKTRLVALARTFHEEVDVDRVAVIYSSLEKMERKEGNGQQGDLLCLSYNGWL